MVSFCVYIVYLILILRQMFNVRGVKGVEIHIACVKYCTKNKGSNAMYVERVESSSIYTIRFIMLCMWKVLKEVQNGLTHLCS